MSHTKRYFCTALLGQVVHYTPVGFTDVVYETIEAENEQHARAQMHARYVDFGVLRTDARPSVTQH